MQDPRVPPVMEVAKAVVWGLFFTTMIDDVHMSAVCQEFLLRFLSHPGGLHAAALQCPDGPGIMVQHACALGTLLYHAASSPQTSQELLRLADGLLEHSLEALSRPSAVEELLALLDIDPYIAFLAWHPSLRYATPFLDAVAQGLLKHEGRESLPELLATILVRNEALVKHCGDGGASGPAHQAGAGSGNSAGGHRGACVADHGGPLFAAAGRAAGGHRPRRVPA